MINKDSFSQIAELKTILLKESLNLLKQQKQTNDDDEVIMFWINDLDNTTYDEYALLGENLNEVIGTLINENQNIITRIIELRIKDDNNSIIR